MEEILKISQRELDDVIELGRRLIRTPTENPPGNYEELSPVIYSTMKEAGLEAHILKGDENKPNVVGIWYGSSSKGETLLLSGHMDVVESGDPKEWLYPPYAGEVKEDHLWGRGAADMKGAIACMICAVKLLRDRGWKPKFNLMIATTVDDEIAGKMGMKFLIEEGFSRAGLPRPSFHILGEATNLNLMVSFKGRTWIRIEVAGKSAHGGAPKEGINAIEKAIDIAISMRDLVKESELNPHPMLGPDTCNLGTIRGGTRVNVVPANCLMEYDIRMGPPNSAKMYINKVRDLLSRLSEERGIKISLFEVFEERDPVEVSPENEKVKTLSEIISKVTGRAPLLKGTLSAGDLYYTLKAGIPGVWFGPGEPSIIHKVNERVPLEHLRLATEVYMNIALTLCQTA